MEGTISSSWSYILNTLFSTNGSEKYFFFFPENKKDFSIKFKLFFFFNLENFPHLLKKLSKMDSWVVMFSMNYLVKGYLKM